MHAAPPPTHAHARARDRRASRPCLRSSWYYPKCRHFTLQMTTYASLMPALARAPRLTQASPVNVAASLACTIIALLRNLRSSGCPLHAEGAASEDVTLPLPYYATPSSTMRSV